MDFLLSDVSVCYKRNQLPRRVQWSRRPDFVTIEAGGAYEEVQH